MANKVEKQWEGSDQVYENHRLESHSWNKSQHCAQSDTFLSVSQSTASSPSALGLPLPNCRDDILIFKSRSTIATDYLAIRI